MRAIKVSRLSMNQEQNIRKTRTTLLGLSDEQKESAGTCDRAAKLTERQIRMFKPRRDVTADLLDLFGEEVSGLKMTTVADSMHSISCHDMTLPCSEEVGRSERWGEEGREGRGGGRGGEGKNLWHFKPQGYRQLFLERQKKCRLFFIAFCLEPQDEYTSKTKCSRN